MDLSEAIRFLRADGRRITQERRLLLQIIEKNSHLDAAEIYELARKENPKISLSTVYRTVNLLRGLGLVEASPLGEDHYHYEVRLQEHYHLICLGCNKVIEIPPSDAVKRLGAERGFEIVGVKLEIFGYCEECQEKRASNKRKRALAAPEAEKADRIVDLRGVPLLKHPGMVSREVERSHPGDLLEIVTDDPGRPEMAPKMLEKIDGVEVINVWREGTVCHALVRKV